MKDHPLHRIRKTGMSRLEQQAFPTRRDEEWKYTSVNRVLQPEYQEGQDVTLTANDVEAFLVPDLEAHLMVFVNGIFQQELSSQEAFAEGLTVTDIASALTHEQHGTAVEAQLHQLLLEEGDAFRSLNAAFIRGGLFVHVAAGKTIEKPIYCLHLAAPGDQPVMGNHTKLVQLERNSELTIMEAYFELPGAEGTYFNNVASHFKVAQNAHAHHYRIQQEGAAAFVISNIDITQERDSTYSSYLLDLGARLVRNNLNAVHLDEGITTNYYGAYFGNDKQHIDNHTFIDHAQPHCQSNELYKGILTDSAKGVFNGKVMVRRDAQKINAFQQNSSLVLSDKAVMDTKPQLEIYADDVRCSHGATIGQLDEAAVFYLRSRGLSDAKARAMLQHAFISEAIEPMKHEAVLHYAEQLIAQKFTH